MQEVVIARVYSFAPIEAKDANVLILGSMPGRASLIAGRYYAHPHNVFWRILCEVLRIKSSTPYSTKTRAMKSSQIALWDVLKTCSRRGSLDSNIEDEVPNDFAAFFKKHPRIKRVFFNGTKAEASFKRHVLPHISPNGIKFSRLPSTSPANASIPYSRKLKAWKSALRLP